MFETLFRPHEVNAIPTPLPITEVSDRLKKAEQRREEKRLRQIASARSNGGGDGGKRKREEGNDDGNVGLDPKRLKSDGPVEDDTGQSSFPQETPPVVTASTPPPTTKTNVSKAMPEVRGHTSYLTFACLLPIQIQPVQTEALVANQGRIDECT
jgi:tRNA (adenine57-N1/adenine58-N1)-methyltransferase